MNQIDFREEIKILLKKKNISIAKLSRLADINSSTLYNYLSKRSEIAADKLAQLFNILNSSYAKKGQNSE